VARGAAALLGPVQIAHRSLQVPRIARWNTSTGSGVPNGARSVGISVLRPAPVRWNIQNIEVSDAADAR
jgi:hypothetical protein